MLYLASDHRGFKAKEKLKEYLKKLSVKFEDLGNEILDSEDDFPDFAKKVAEKVSQNPQNRGILICGSGLGMAICANKFKNVRACPCFKEEMARVAKKHLNCNILCLGADFLTLDKIKKIVKVWLDTKFERKKKYQRRIKKISIYENTK